MPRSVKAEVTHAGVLAPAAQALVKEVGALFGAVAAGGDGAHRLALHEGGAPLRAVELTKGVDQPVHGRLEGRGAVPRVDGTGKDEEIAAEDAVKNIAHVIVNGAVGGAVVGLTGAAGAARGDGEVVEGKDLCLVSGIAPRIEEDI